MGPVLGSSSKQGCPTGLSHRAVPRCLSLEFQRDELAQGQVCKRWSSSSGSSTEQGMEPSPGDDAEEHQCLGEQGMKALLTLGQPQTPLPAPLPPLPAPYPGLAAPPAATRLIGN